MMNTVRTEAGARAAGEGKEGDDSKGEVAIKSEPGDAKGERSARPRSEGEGSSYDDDYGLGRLRGGQDMVKRESI